MQNMNASQQAMMQSNMQQQQQQQNIPSPMANANRQTPSQMSPQVTRDNRLNHPHVLIYTMIRLLKLNNPRIVQ